MTGGWPATTCSAPYARDVLSRLGRHSEAAAELEQAPALAPTRHERILLMERAAAAAATAD